MDLGRELDGYSDALCSDERIAHDLANPDEAFLAEHVDMFTLDTTVIATALGQLLDAQSMRKRSHTFMSL